MLIVLKGSDGKVKLHEALAVFVDPSRWRSWFKAKGSMNGNSVCFNPFLNREHHLEGSTNTTNAS